MANTTEIYGALDKYTTGGEAIDSDYTFFKVSYPRHAPFALDVKDYVAQGGTLDWGRKITFDADRTADLLWHLYMVADIAALNTGAVAANNSFVDDVGRAMVSTCRMLIGGQEIDRITGEYIHAEEELTVLEENHFGPLTGKFGVQAALDAQAVKKQRLYVHLPFFHTESSAQALPMLGSGRTAIKYELQVRAKLDCLNATGHALAPNAALGALDDIYLSANLVYLSEAQRTAYVESTEPHEYLINTVQEVRTNIVAGSTSARIDIQLNNPVKELIMFGRTDVNTTARRWFNWDGEASLLASTAYAYEGEVFESLRMTMNGNDRVKAQDPLYYRVVQPSQYHTRIPAKRIYVFSFGVDPEGINPSGSLNFSQIDRWQQHLVFPQAAGLAGGMEWVLYARSLNLLLVDGGAIVKAFE